MVLERQNKKKGATLYDPAELSVKAKSNGDLTLESGDGTVIRRDVTKVKKLATPMTEAPTGTGVISDGKLGQGEYPTGRPKRIVRLPDKFASMKLYEVDVHGNEA